MKDASENFGRTLTRILFVLPTGLFSQHTFDNPALHFAPSGTITNADLNRAIETTCANVYEGRALALALPFQYEVEGIVYHKPPLGAFGHQLRTFCIGYYLDQPLFLALRSACHGIGLELMRVLPESLAYTYEANAEETRAKGVILVDVRPEVTYISGIVKGVQVGLATLPYGSEELIRQIAACSLLPSSVISGALAVCAQTAAGLQTLQRTFDNHYAQCTDYTVSDLKADALSVLNDLARKASHAISINPAMGLFAGKHVHLAGFLAEGHGLAQLSKQAFTNH
ncbi:unnamed protein product [Didymodactylos carnosus]|uniref:Uncharacterized protein n=1 Tax=Didymodactylos carnosus TaxID=1234261 RepID=A0A8S2CVA1_9BILA|nr:unnamed protein product [Didymodactylos carnosus]CAF3523906.1 unnamed protein product [Didymodactylos carnosus]